MQSYMAIHVYKVSQFQKNEKISCSQAMLVKYICHQRAKSQLITVYIPLYPSTFLSTSLTRFIIFFTVNNLASSPTDNDEKFSYPKETIVNSIPPNLPTTLTNNYNNKNSTVSDAREVE